jgi:hypothetical protein
MVVADGHGGKRYSHSDVGSRLACELSLKLVAKQLGKWATVQPGAIDRWREWLEAKFPTTLHQEWLAATENHWRQERSDKEVTEESFSPQAYGTTIAMVIMTPAWWGHTGLGDWDLLRVGSGGAVELVNEELEEEQTGGEATYSLCLSNAPSHFASRTEVHLITEQQPSFSLLLSTDGVRKSCSTDADFFAIAQYLCEAVQPRQGDATLQLNADLDRISSQGSGDDVSVAIGRWLPVREKSRLLQTNQPLIVQPGKENAGHGASNLEPVEGKTRNRFFFWVAVFVVLLAGALVLGVAKLNQGPFSGGASGSAEPSPELVAALRKAADDLCQTPTDDFITGPLTNRKQTFEDLARSEKTPDAFLSSPSKDSYGALIAWSFLHPSLEPIRVNSPRAAGILNPISGILPLPIRPGGSQPSQSTPVVFCPELIQALSSQRKRAQAEPVTGRSSGELKQVNSPHSQTSKPQSHSKP